MYVRWGEIIFTECVSGTKAGDTEGDGSLHVLLIAIRNYRCRRSELENKTSGAKTMPRNQANKL